MNRKIPVLIAVCLAAISMFQAARALTPWQTSANATCPSAMSAIPTNAKIQAQARVTAAAQSDTGVNNAEELAKRITELEVTARCTLQRNPTDGHAVALLAWSAWQRQAPMAEIAPLLNTSYRLHPFEHDTGALRQLIIAANWDRLNEDMKSIARADQSLRLATGHPRIVLPQLARLYLEAGTASDLYHEALDRIGRTAPEYLADFAAAATGRAKPPRSATEARATR